MTDESAAALTSDPRADAIAAIRLPRHALLVSDSLEHAAALAADFDEVRVSTPEDLESVVLEGGAPECVGLSGVSVDAGVLAQVVAQLLRRGAPDLTVFLDISDPVGRQLVHQDGSPLAGLAVVGESTVSGVPTVVLGRGTPGSVPDLSRFRDWPASVWNARELAFSEADRLAADLNDKTLRRRISELEAQLETARRAAAGPTDRPSPAVKAAPTAKRAGRRRVLILRSAAAGLVLVAGVAVLLALVTSTGYVGGLLSAVSLLGAVVAAYLVRGQRRLARTLAKTRADVRRGSAAQQGRDAQLTKRLDTVAQLLRDGPPDIAAIERQVEVVGASSVDIAHTLRNLSNGLELPAIDARQKKAYSDALHQTQAVANLFSLLPVNAIVPLMGGWAASPDVVLVLIEELLVRKPRLIVECGSGVSTLWLALAIQKYGLDSRIVCLEHDDRFGAATRQVLERHGVAHLVDVRDAPLGPTGLEGHTTRWYDVSALDGLDQIGLLFVDGPPEATGPLVRYPAIPLLRDRFAAEVTIVLDDLIRPMEQEITKLWLSELPDFELHRLPLEKGAAVFRRR